MVAPPPPTFLDAAGTYRLGTLLGVGGMAEVYRGEKVGAEGFSRPVAIKRILPQFSADEMFSAMFINEAQLSSLLHHANIVDVLDFNRDPEGRLYQILEFVEGRDLEKLAATGSLPTPIIAHCIGQILRGLDHAHNAVDPRTGKHLGIVHRDCTPSNVLISWSGDLKVSDFGIAKAVYSTHATQSGLAKGKAGYMSPEQLHGQDLDGRSDLFAVGVMLWELLVGRILFAGNSVEQVISQVLEYAKGWSQIDPAHVANPAASLPLSELATWLMATDRERRPADAAAALAGLHATGLMPADGVELLADELARRFPGKAPVRHTGGRVAAPLVSGVAATVASSPGMTAAPLPATSVPKPPTTPLGPRPSTAPVPRAAPALTPVASGEVAQAAAATPTVGRRWGLVVAGLVVVVGAAVGVTLALSGGSGGTDGDAPAADLGAGYPREIDAALSPDAGVEVAIPVDAAIPIDAAIPLDAAAPPPPIDAASPAAPPIDPKRHRPGHKRDAGATMFEDHFGGGT